MPEFSPELNPVGYTGKPIFNVYASLNLVSLIRRSRTNLLTPPRSFANFVACFLSFSGIFIYSPLSFIMQQRYIRLYTKRKQSGIFIFSKNILSKTLDFRIYRIYL